jgi:spermidine dehydrogenase
MSMKRNPDITRRDFINGMALSLAAGSTLSPLEILARQSDAGGDYYPPALTGLRGSHAGSFDVAHAVAWAGKKFPIPANLTDDLYDLVVVGGGISGLSAAKFYRDRASRDAKILILDNHDDFGGHAKRNEFNVDGKTLVGYGGSQTIAGPKNYSPVSKQLLIDIGIDVQRFYDFYDQEFYAKRNLTEAIYFDQGKYGVDRVLPNPVGGLFGGPVESAVSESNIRRMPISTEAQDALMTLLQGGVDYLEGKSIAEKEEFLLKITFEKYLQDVVGVPQDLTDILRDQIAPLFGVGWDSLSALQAAKYQNFGTWELGIDTGSIFDSDEPYIHHFPDGNGGLARAQVRDLIPAAVPGQTMESLATARAQYSELDMKRNSVRIRLNSTAVDVRHTPNEKNVDVTYVRDGETFRVRGRHVVLACDNKLIPYICSETPEEQVAAINYATKVPLVLGNVAIRNWRAFDKLGFQSFYSPGDVLFKLMGLDFPVSMGDYRFSPNPDEPIVVQGWYCPAAPGQGLTAKEQHVIGRRKLYEQSFDEFESSIHKQFDGMLGDGGFDAERDIAAITVNRWPHGYAYEYNDYDDPPEYNRYNGPHLKGAAQMGRISIANADASAYAYVNGAIDAADRAVNEQIADS